MSRGSFVNDLLCAQLHPPGSYRMVMVVVHMVNPNEHERVDYRAMIAHVNETLKRRPDWWAARGRGKKLTPIEFE